MREPVDTPIGKMWLDADGIRWHQLDEGVVPTPEDAARVKEIASQLTSGSPAPVVVDIRGVSFASQATRDAFAESGGLESATAIVVGSTLSQALARWFIGRSNPDRPVQVFRSPERAAEWARQHL